MGSIKELKKQESLLKRCYYFVCRRCYAVSGFIVEIKYFFQRLFKGYDDTDMWSLNGGVLRRIYKPLKAAIKYIREEGYSYPIFEGSDIQQVELTDSEGVAKWHEILSKIELAFDLMWEEEKCLDSYFAKTGEQHMDDNKKIQEGCELFGKYFQDLWD